MAADIELIPNGTVTSAKGYLAGATFAGINRYSRHKLDLGILFSEVPCSTVGVFTKNKIKAAPVILSKQKLPSSTIKAIVVNSGCANASTGKAGIMDAMAVIAAVAQKTKVKTQDVLIASTGVIGTRLPLDSINEALRKIELSKDGGKTLAKAIMTTDTTTKEVAVTTTSGDFIVGGIAKGSGMIHPQLGTLLCFLTTDVVTDVDFLAVALRKAVDISFNMVSIDGDTSPNDTVLLMANGLASNTVIKHNSKDADIFQEVLNRACIQLARAIAHDGEGATKLIQVIVKGAASTEDARSAAKTVVGSQLVKAALYGNDPNWGRIIAAVGRSGADLIESKLDMYIGDVQLIKKGSPLSINTEEVVRSLKTDNITIVLDINIGKATATAWGCDLSEEYVIINSQYTT
ncbi:MAG: bifunctional glutamate N-acetyltransferase/amino-acid acetyltransferase ArgJ [Dehalococcoidia bacterium]|nr:MAG: bifunctional glutamate N-acetyltransferase/amino-acid acetyltransferase ArgJ [Dehalococcoidia bacterium]